MSPSKRPELPTYLTPIRRWDRETLRALYGLQAEIDAVIERMRIAHEKIIVELPVEEE